MSFSVIKLVGRRLNSKHGAELEQAARTAWQSGVTVAALDLTEFASIDSLGVGALVTVLRRKPPGSRLVLCGVCPQIRNVLEMVRVHHLFEFAESAESLANSA